jgi:hypothetical protein
MLKPVMRNKVRAFKQNKEQLQQLALEKSENKMVFAPRV